MTDASNVAAAELRQFIERIERLEEEKKTIADDIRDVKSEAKARGYSVKAINEILKLRKKDANERAEEQAVLDTYKAALGMIPHDDVADASTSNPASRKDRQRRRTSEAMEDNISLSAEMLADELISEEAHAENVAVSIAVSNKYGAGGVNAPAAPLGMAGDVLKAVPITESMGVGALALSVESPGRRLFSPHCLNRELCRSGTTDHCLSCRKAMASKEVEPA